MADNRPGYGYARERGKQVLIRMLSSGSPHEAAVKAAVKTFETTWALANGSKRPKDATASKLSSYLRSDDSGAVHWALDQNVTGGLKRCKFRAYCDTRGQARVAEAIAYCDNQVDLLKRERLQAARDVVTYIRDYNRAKNKAAKKHARDMIRAILHTWKSDSTVLQAARSQGWNV